MLTGHNKLQCKHKGHKAYKLSKLVNKLNNKQQNLDYPQHNNKKQQNKLKRSLVRVLMIYLIVIT